MVILVTTPSGTITRAPTYPINHHASTAYSQDPDTPRMSDNNHHSSLDTRMQMTEQRPFLSSASTTQLQGTSSSEIAATATNAGSSDHLRAPSPPLSSAPSPGITTSASNAATVLGGMNSRSDGLDASSGSGQTNEFHHAMTYINRIKTRFVENQEVYKGFLQLLQAYQKEQMNIQEVMHRNTAAEHCD
jgi:histone deacetylase complex regulatory component SIN3